MRQSSPPPHPSPRSAKPPKHDGASLEERNIAAIAKVEAAVIGERSRGERLVRALIRQVGRPCSVMVHVGCFAGWLCWNGGPAAFDPYPFNLLALVTGIEAILLGLLILASQNRLQHEADRRAHLHLQIAMMGEIESTRMLQVLDRIRAHLGIEAGPGVSIEELTEETDPHRLVERIKTSMPAEE